jgi:hypothetical protein
VFQGTTRAWSATRVPPFKVPRTSTPRLGTSLKNSLDRSPGTATHADETRLRIRHDADTQYREARLADL